MFDDWQSHDGLVTRLARKLARPNVPASELYAVGLVGLWQAARKFNPEAGVNFETYAKFRVRGEIADYLRATFGRKGKHHRTTRLDDAFDVGGRDKELAAVDARDELENLAKGPPVLAKSKWDGTRLILYRGRVQGMTEWAGELGIKPSAFTQRVAKWGVRDAMARPAGKYQFRSTAP